MFAGLAISNWGAVETSLGIAVKETGSVLNSAEEKMDRLYKCAVYIYITGWWFGTFFIFPYIGNNHPN